MTGIHCSWKLYSAVLLFIPMSNEMAGGNGSVKRQWLAAGQLRNRSPRHENMAVAWLTARKPVKSLAIILLFIIEMMTFW